MSTNDTGTSDSPKGQKKLQSRKVNDDIEKKGATISGGKPNPININPVIEQAEHTAVTNLNMRAQPVHKGHVKVIKAVEDEAKRVGGSAHIVTSHSEGDEKNPIPTSKKVGYLKKVASQGTHVSSTSREAPSLLHTAARLNRHAHHLVVVAGSDRAKEYETLLNKYNGKEGPHGHYNFKSITVKSIGRDPDSEGTEGISGTKMREHAKNGNIAGFKAGLPPELHQHAEEMMNDINRASKKMKEDIDDLFGETFIDTEDTMSVLEAIDAAHREAIPRSGDRKKIQFVARKDQDRKKSPVPYRQAAVQKNIDEAGLPNTSNYTPSMFKDKTSSTSPKMPKVSDYNPSMFNKSTSTTKLPNVNKYSPSMFKTEAKKPKSGWDRIWNPKTASGRKMIAASDEAQKAAEALRAAAKQKTNEAFDQLDEISKELVGQVNKKRTLMNKPSKTKKASDVLQRAVDKARENTKVGERPVNEGGLWANIWAKRKRIKAGSGERMRKPGEKGAPSAAAIKSAQEEFDYHIDEAAESGLAAKASKSGISIGTLRKVYRRGVAAWNSGHRPGTTPQQWGMARVNSYIAKGKGTYHGADKDLREDLDENYAEKNKKYHAGLSKSTAKARVAHWKKMDKLSDRDPRAYEPAPGDATAKTKPSKYTKMYHKKYGK